MAQTRRHALDIFALGTTTAEAKTGYGLDWQSELKQMEVLLALDRKRGRWRSSRPFWQRTPFPPNTAMTRTPMST